MKRIGKKRSSEMSLDLTSFSDIANLLIIFFILTTSMVRPFGRPMDMPASQKPQDRQEKGETPTINVLSDRILYSEKEGQERELTMDELRAELLRKDFPSQDEKHRVVVLETAVDLKYERYFQVATAVAAAGGVVALVTE